MRKNIFLMYLCCIVLVWVGCNAGGGNRNKDSQADSVETTEESDLLESDVTVDIQDEESPDSIDDTDVDDTLIEDSDHEMADTLGDTEANEVNDGDSSETTLPTFTIYELQDESNPSHPMALTPVTLSDVYVTAVDLSGNNGRSFWVQEASGGPYSGIYVFNKDQLDISGMEIGSRVSLTGIYKEYSGVSEVELTSVEIMTSQILPTPLVVNSSDISTTGSQGEAYEGVLVRIENVVVVDMGEFGEFRVNGNLIVDDEIFRYEPVPDVGATYTAITGVLHFSFDQFKLLPRISEDLVPSGNCPGDSDCDGYPDNSDNCPNVSNPDQEDLNDNGVGDICETVQRVTIFDIQDVNRQNHPAVDSQVVVEGVVVTEVNRDGNPPGFWVQEISGGEFSGLFVFTQDYDFSEVVPGALVNVTGQYVEYYDLTEIRMDSYQILSNTSIPDPVRVTSSRLSSQSENYEGILIKVCSDCSVTEILDHGLVRTTCVLLDDDLYRYSLSLGQTFDCISGIFHYSFEEFKLLPRSEADFEGSQCDLSDSDCDGYVDSADNCPNVSNPDQEDLNGNGIGDICESSVLQVRIVQDPGHPQHPAEDSVVELSNVIITAVSDGRGFWVQDQSGSPEYSGIYIYAETVDMGGLTRGTIVSLSGVYKEYYELSEIELQEFTVEGQASEPMPATVSLSSLLADPEPFEGVLVAPFGGGSCVVNELLDYGMVQTTCLTLDDDIYTYTLMVGDSFQQIQGILHFSFDEYKLLPRDSADFIE